ncbi:MAG: MlaD family protein [Marmoricola sp.]
MKIAHAAVPKLRLAVVVAFVALCATIFGFLWTKAGGWIPGISSTGYQVKIPMANVDNLVFQSDVTVAGVDVGKVQNISVQGNTDMVTLSLDPSVAPLHQGAVITVRNKTLVEETYLDVKDGKGPALPDGATLPQAAGRPAVKLNDVLSSLNPTTRKDLSKLIQSSSAGVAGRQSDVNALLTGLGEVGDSAGALHALAQQSEQLKSLVKASTTVLQSLDTQQGRIVGLVRDAQTITSVTSQHQGDVENLMRVLPPLLDSVHAAGGSLQQLASPLGVVASNLRQAAPDLNAALLQLPSTTRDLRGLVPSLNSTLTKAPTTLRLLTPFQNVASPWMGTLVMSMSELNPMLAYLSPYGHDLASYWSNFTGFVSSSDGNGPIARVKPIFSSNSLDLPNKLSTVTGYNPYPAPMTQTDPKKFTGTYPHITKDPIPR